MAMRLATTQPWTTWETMSWFKCLQRQSNWIGATRDQWQQRKLEQMRNTRGGTFALILRSARAWKVHLEGCPGLLHQGSPAKR